MRAQQALESAAVAVPVADFGFALRDAVAERHVDVGPVRAARKRDRHHDLAGGGRRDLDACGRRAIERRQARRGHGEGLAPRGDLENGLAGKDRSGSTCRARHEFHARNPRALVGLGRAVLVLIEEGDEGHGIRDHLGRGGGCAARTHAGPAACREEGAEDDPGAGAKKTSSHKSSRGF